MIPKRVQYKRGMTLPPNTVYVGRPTIFGNPFSWLGREESVRAYRQWMTKRLSQDKLGRMIQEAYWNRTGKETASEIFVVASMCSQRSQALAYLPELRDKDLACWCKPGETCHADVLLKLANREEKDHA